MSQDISRRRPVYPNTYLTPVDGAWVADYEKHEQEFFGLCETLKLARVPAAAQHNTFSAEQGFGFDLPRDSAELSDDVNSN